MRKGKGETIEEMLSAWTGATGSQSGEKRQKTKDDEPESVSQYKSGRDALKRCSLGKWRYVYYAHLHVTVTVAFPNTIMTASLCYTIESLKVKWKSESQNLITAVAFPNMTVSFVLHNWKSESQKEVWKSKFNHGPSIWRSTYGASSVNELWIFVDPFSYNLNQ